jgi:hypothetical protein
MHTFATPTPSSAILDIPAGRVQFAADDRADTVVEVLPTDPAKRRDLKTANQTTVDYTDGVLRIHTHVANNQYLGPSGSVTVTVALPAGSHIEATTTCAELRGVGRLGDVAFEGAYRQITLDEAASVHLTAIDGDVEIGHLNGPAQITTTRGDIRITQATRGTVVLATQTGSISVGAAAGISAVLDAGTSHGRINNTLTNNGVTELDIHATTSYGDILAHSL